MKSMKFIFLYAIVIIAILVIIVMREGWFSSRLNEAPTSSAIPRDFKECVAAGMPIQESYPRQCRVSNNVVYTEYIGNELEKNDLITIEYPRPNAVVENTFIVKGQARGYWYFEASFPITVIDLKGNEIAKSIAQAQGEWMTENFVPFSSRLEIPKTFSGEAKLLLHKDNPSGEARNDDQLEIPIVVAQ
jgi:hypothetical protein